MRQELAEYGVPTVTYLVGAGVTHTFPGKPNEDGNFLMMLP